jgi:hypothetical protein
MGGVVDLHRQDAVQLTQVPLVQPQAGRAGNPFQQQVCASRLPSCSAMHKPCLQALIVEYTRNCSGTSSAPIGGIWRRSRYGA